MFGKLKDLFAANHSRAAPPARSAKPSSPLEILMPDGAVLSEAPRLAGKTLSYLVASTSETNIIEFDSKGPRAHSSDKELAQFLPLIVGAGQFTDLIGQCRAVMYPPQTDGSIGSLACLQQGLLHSFEVFELSPLPDVRWELRRVTRAVEMAGA